MNESSKKLFRRTCSYELINITSILYISNEHPTSTTHGTAIVNKNGKARTISESYSCIKWQVKNIRVFALLNTSTISTIANFQLSLELTLEQPQLRSSHNYGKPARGKNLSLSHENIKRSSRTVRSPSHKFIISLCDLAESSLIKIYRSIIDHCHTAARKFIVLPAATTNNSHTNSSTAYKVCLIDNKTAKFRGNNPIVYTIQFYSYPLFATCQVVMTDYFLEAELFEGENLIASDSEESTLLESPITDNETHSIGYDQDLINSEQLEGINKSFGELGVDKHLEQSSPIFQKIIAKDNKSNNLSVKNLSELQVQPEVGESSRNSYKRHRDSSADNSINCDAQYNPPKKPRVLIMSDAEDETKLDLFLILLLPDVEEESLFSKKHLEKLDVSVRKVIKAEANPQVKFEFCGPDRGRYKFVCPNEVAKEWALGIVPKLTDIFEKPKVLAVDGGLVPKLVRASIIFNGKPPNMVDFFEGIENKNIGLKTLHWRTYTKKKIQGNKSIIFIGIDEASVDTLKSLGFRPYFEQGRIRISITDNNN